MLDTATGLGYTACQASRGARRVITIELDPAVLAIARLNPWSKELFESSRLEQLLGDSADVVSGLRDEISVVAEPSRPSSVWPAAKTWKLVTESDRSKETWTLPSTILISSPGRICFGSSWNCFLIHPDGSDRRLLAREAGGAAWSPDGRWLYFSDYPAGTHLRKVHHRVRR